VIYRLREQTKRMRRVAVAGPEVAYAPNRRSAVTDGYPLDRAELEETELLVERERKRRDERHLVTD